ncbi:hypothetical protein [Hymenobacter elongatus]|nr:hypothetical protein [Hymenobacter elongatus]
MSWLNPRGRGKYFIEVEAALRGQCTDYRQLDLFEPTVAVPYIPIPSLA